MIDWTDELRAQIGASSRAVLSYLGVSGYPVALPLPFTYDSGKNHFVLPIPNGRPAISKADRVSLTLLRYDPQLANERYLPFYGQLAEQEDTWLFIPSRVVIQRWGGKRDT